MAINADDAGELIRRIILGFIEGEPFLAGLSPRFGIHEGRTLDVWIDHELQEFARCKKAFELDAGMSVAVDRMDADGSVIFFVRSGKGDLVYQDAWRIDGDGCIVGDGRAFEIVSKFHFARGRATRRALAVRSVRGRVTSVVPIGLTADECLFEQGLNSDAFSTISMLLPNDDLKALWARFRISDETGARATETVWLRGISETVDLFPFIEGRRVMLPGEARAWELNVLLQDGTSRCVEHPIPGVYLFSQPVRTAVLTDAMDNDWIADATCSQVGTCGIR